MILNILIGLFILLNIMFIYTYRKGYADKYGDNWELKYPHKVKYIRSIAWVVSEPISIALKLNLGDGK
jgi:hypothetical protein